MGIPEDEADYYDTEFKAGRTIVTVRTSNRYDEAMSVLRRFGAYDISTRGSQATTGYPSDTPVVTPGAPIPSSSHQSLDVPVTGDEPTAECHPAAGSGEELRVPVREEQVRVEKSPADKEP